MRRTGLVLALSTMALSGVARAAGDGWMRLDVEGHSASFPGQPILVTKVEDHPAGRIETRSHTASRDGRQYTLSITRLPAELLALGPDELLAAYTRSLPDGSQASFRQEHFRGYPGLTIEGTTSSTRAIRQRAFLRDGRLVAVTVEWPAAEGQPASARDFEDGLRLSPHDGGQAVTAADGVENADLHELKLELFQLGGWIATLGGIGLVLGAAVFLSLRFRLFET